MRKSSKVILYLLLIYSLIALVSNIWRYINIRNSITPLSENWYSYSKAELSVNQNIYHSLLKIIHPHDSVWISMFLWPYAKDQKYASADLKAYDTDFASYLNKQNTTGDIYIDSINLDYKITPTSVKSNSTIQASNNMNWHIAWQPTALPNNLFMWALHTPLLQNLIFDSNLTVLQQMYSILKLSSNHQKIVVVNNGEIASIGTRNFNRLNWNNDDMMVTFYGDFAKAIYKEAADTIATLNPQLSPLVKNSNTKALELAKHNVDLLTRSSSNLARLLPAPEIKPTILYLIDHSSAVEAELASLSDSDIIDAFNRLINRGGKLRIILDQNQYTFSVRLTNMPNVIAVKDILPKAEVRFAKTSYQMHNKTALFHLSNGNTVFLSGSANWTQGALVYYAFNDLNFLILNDVNVNNHFLASMNQTWLNSIMREDFKINYSTLKWALAKLMLLTGLNPW